MNHIVMLLCCSSMVVMSHGREWQPTPDFLKAVRLVESSNGLNRVGDNGESLGDFQLSEAAWLDVNVWRRARGLKTYPYSSTVFHGYISRVYASNYLTILYTELDRKLKRPPTHAELYAAYNMGLASFAQCNFQLHRVNPVTRARCETISLLLRSKESVANSSTRGS
jgi:hypothetical protein